MSVVNLKSLPIANFVFLPKKRRREQLKKLWDFLLAQRCEQSLTRMTRAAQNIQTCLSRSSNSFPQIYNSQFQCVCSTISVGLALPFGREHRACFSPNWGFISVSSTRAPHFPTKDGFASRASVAGGPRLGMDSMLVCDLDASMLPCWPLSCSPLLCPP